MEDMMIKRHKFVAANPHRLAMHKESKTICKPNPKIRIIHIFAPEIIKTDVENFRELVQRLTGKPGNEESCRSKKPWTVNALERDLQREPTSNHVSLCSKRNGSMKLELRNGFRGFDPKGRIKLEEEGIWDAETSGGFLGGFADLEGFMTDMNGEFPL